MLDDVNHGAATGGRLTVDLAALAANWLDLRRLAPGAETSAVLKADAYGHGLAEAGSALWQAGCRTFFVALPREGAILRTVLPQATIYVLNGFFPGAAELHRQSRLRPVLGGPEEIDAWIAAGPMPEPPALHVDTGMNRLGLSGPEFTALAGDPDRLRALRPALLMSHLSCADDPQHPLNREQIHRFAEARRMLPGVPGSLANSAGLHLGAEVHHDLTRPGIASYGGIAAPGVAALRAVATVEGRIIRIRPVPAGAAVGYGAAWTADRDSRVALVSVGYADGYLRGAGASDRGPGAFAAIGGERVPLVGRVSMDLLAIDVTDLAPGPSVGDWVELFGPTIPVDEVARHAGTIGYELLTGLGQRYERRTIS